MIEQRSVRRLFPLLVFLLATLQYLNTISHEYAWDDKLVITANEYTKMGVRGLPEIFTKRVSVPFKSEYRPIPQALHAIEYQAFGGTPRAGHVFNILWYGVTCVMVYALVRFVFVGIDALFALLVAVLFVVHPLHVEVVANIKGRDEILALFFGVCSIILLVGALERSSWKLLAAGSACFAAACLSKTNAVTLLAIVPVVAWYRSESVAISRKLLRATALIALCGGLLVAGIRMLQSTVSSDLALHLNSTVLNNIFLWTARPDTIVPTALVIVARYLGLFLFPHPLIHLYGYDQIPLNTWLDPAPWLVLGGLAGTFILLLKTWRLKLPLAFGIVWAVVTYSPYSNLWFYAPDTMADRYLFIPSLGLAIVAVYGIFWVGALDLRSPVLAGGRAKAALAVFTVLLAGYFARTTIANQDWRNDATLIHNRIRYMENNAAAQVIYAYQLNKESAELSSAAARQQKKAAAMRALTHAIRIYPDFQGAWIAIGKLFAEQGIYHKAELSFLKAQRLEPLNPDAYFCLGAVYLTQRNHELAIPYLEKAVLLDSRMQDAYVLLGRAYLQANNVENLGAMASTARKWFPENVELNALLATFYFRKEDYGQAVELAKVVTAKDPNNVLALAILSSPLTQPFSKQ
jgi:cytochrome c-type biogenesis protein CcmH/NrfG